MANFNVNEDIWQELMYYINNFYDVVAYTKGRDIYPDRVTLSRNKEAEQILNNMGGKNIEYVTLNARSREKSPKAIKEKRLIAEKVITDSIFANRVFNFDKEDKNKKDYSKLFDYVKSRLTISDAVDFEKLNDFILNAYKKLYMPDALKVASFRESVIDKCVRNGLFSEEFASEQKAKFPNSSIKLQSLYNVKDEESAELYGLSNKESAITAWFFQVVMVL